MKKSWQILILFIFIQMGIFVPDDFLFASETDGTIDPTYKYAWGENIGWINFGATNGNIHITDYRLSGYALSENVGWINLDGVSNDSEGHLSGYAWGENIGYLKFDPTNGGVVINSSGEFIGQALSENIGWIIFDGDYKVKTDWRPKSSRHTGRSSHSSSGSLISKIIPSDINVVPAVIENVWNAIEDTTIKIVDSIIPDFLKSSDEPAIVEIPIEETIKKETPAVFASGWDLLPRETINQFVLAPLPREISKLAMKFPELGKTLKEVGVNKITDVAKLQNTELSLPGLTERSGIVQTEGIPIAQLSEEIKDKIPSEVVFAKTGSEQIDFNISLTVDGDGNPQQKIKTIVGKPLELVMKPDYPVDSIKGYVVFKSNNREISELNIPTNSLLASAIFSRPIFTKAVSEPIKIENELLLMEFDYTDPDGDGIYTAKIDAPLVDGEYEIVTVLNFRDPEKGSKEIRLTTVIDPEGYIYEKYQDKEIRIPNATVSLYSLNSETGEYELWSAEKYQQENPQKTGKSGSYSFLVPEGQYYLEAVAKGYRDYKGEIFEVREGSGVHLNIEMVNKNWLAKILDWKSLLLIVVLVLLLYNFYRDKIRDKVMGLKKF